MELLDQLATVMKQKPRVALEHLIKHYTPRAIADFLAVLGESPKTSYSPPAVKPEASPAQAKKPQSKSQTRPPDAVSALDSLMQSLA
jgi:hypothetical protein